jgi:hypothetical protein
MPGVLPVCSGGNQAIRRNRREFARHSVEMAGFSKSTSSPCKNRTAIAQKVNGEKS